MAEWSDDQIARLRQLWDEGHSSTQIGRRLGMSKNAIVGKVHRLGLAGRPSPIKQSNGGDHKRPGRPPRTNDAAGRPIEWARWFDRLPLAARRQIANASHIAPCDLAGVGGKLWTCSCGASQPGAEQALTVASPPPLPTPKPIAPAPLPATRYTISSQPTAFRVDDPKREAVRGPTLATTADAYAKVRRGFIDTSVLVSHQFPPDRKCLWPIGEPRTKAFRFCSAHVDTPGPYCDACRKRAYAKHDDERAIRAAAA